MPDDTTRKLLALFALSLAAELPQPISRRVSQRLAHLGDMAWQDGDMQIQAEARSLATLISAAG